MPKPDQPSAFERQSGSRTPKGRGPRETEFVAVWEGDSEAAASIIAGSLEADGIRAVMHGSRPLPQFGMAAAGAGSWGVSVPSSKAARARILLRESGEDGGIVSAETDFSATQLSSLKFVLFAILAPITIISIFLIARDLAGN